MRSRTRFRAFAARRNCWKASVGDEDRALTRLICEETDRIVKLVDRMEAFSDERPAPRESLNIHAVLDHVKRLAQAGFARHIRFDGIYDPSLPHVLGIARPTDPGLPQSGQERRGSDRRGKHRRRDHAVDRLPSRRAAASPARAPSRSACRSKFAFATTAPGVPPDIAGHLFDPFVTTKSSGTGLGLALVAKVIGDHGGIVEFESHPRRTTFRVLMPLDTPRAAAATRRVQPEAQDERCLRRVRRKGGDRMRGALKEHMNAVRAYSRRRRRRGDPDGSQSGAVAGGLRGAGDRHGRRPLALGRGGRGRSRHHRRRDARRQRLRTAAAHQADAAGSADHRHERAEHVHDRDQGVRARRL